MMATRGLNRRQTNTVLAGAMGFAFALAIAFFVIAMPEDIFEGLVLATGLPSVLAAAEPPLGDTARLIVAALTGSIAGMAVVVSFLFIGRQPQRQTSIVRPFVASELDFPQVKPADAIEPEPEPEFDGVLDLEAVSEPALSAPPPIVEVEAITIEPPKAVEKTADDAPIFLDFKAIRAVTQPANDPPALDLTEWKVVEPERKPEPENQTKKVSRPITAPVHIAEDEPISALMQRLEAGLERRAVRGEAPAQPPAINRSGVGLRSTLDELRQMAVRR